MTRPKVVSITLLCAAAFALMSAGLAQAQPGVQPTSVSASLRPGEPFELTKTVQTIPDFPAADVYFLADSTGSMGGAIANVQANATAIMNELAAALPGSQFGAGDYKDFPRDPYVFQNGASIGSIAAAQAAINAWFASGGDDGSEGQLYALHRLSTEVGWRETAAHVLVWFGDWPGHDPICTAISGLAEDITEGSATADLVANRIRVISVSVTSGIAGGLDGDPTFDAFDYAPFCEIGGEPGQATRITANTLGVAFDDVPPTQVSQAIIDGLRALDVVVTPQAACDPGVTVLFDPPNQTVERGETATFTERITLASPPAAGVVNCTITFLQDGVPPGESFVEHISVESLCPDPTGSPTPTESPTDRPTVIPTVTDLPGPAVTVPPTRCPLLAVTGPAGGMPVKLALGGVVVGLAGGIVLWLAVKPSHATIRLRPSLLVRALRRGED